MIGKKAKTAKAGKAAGGLKGASVGALSSVAPFLIGAGAGLILYCLFNITSTPKNVMVAVAGAAAAVVSIVSGHGFFFSIITKIINLFANGKIPSVTLVRHALGGFAAGFAVAVPVTFARKPFLIAVFGAVLLIVGILLAVLGKDNAKRVAAGAAVLVIAGSLIVPFTTLTSAGLADEAKALGGKYAGAVQMVSGAMTEDGYTNYKNGKLGLNDFVKAHMGGGTGTLSKADLDKKLTSLIQKSKIQAAKSEVQVEVTDSAKGKCSITFTLVAQNCSWKAKEDAFVLGADAINVTLSGTYQNGRIAVSGGSGDVTAASGTILVSAEGGKILLDSSDLIITVANGKTPIYDGQMELSAEMASKSAGLFKKEVDINAPITVDDIVGVYLYTGMNYATETIEDAYFKIEKISNTSFRFTALEVENYGNQDEISIYSFDPSNATGLVKNTANKWFRDISFKRTEGGGMFAVYELHIDFGAGYSVLDHWEMHRVDTWPGKPEETTKPETVPATEAPEPEPGETEPEETEPEVTEPEEPEDVTPSRDREDPTPWEDPDHRDLPHTTAGTVADAVGTAILGGGIGMLLGGFMGGGDGGDGSNGNPNGGDDGGVPSNWMVGNDGTISWIDPGSGKTVTYQQTGYDPDTGQPVFHNAESWGQEYNVDDLKDMYDRTARERDYYKNINDTREKTQEEQRKENEGLSWEAKDWEREKKEI
ncbi:MAG: hypothetical protein II738_01730, partial [Clostridia bacterium]|nr:hypothetical protein [Clostridia bacterium]